MALAGLPTPLNGPFPAEPSIGGRRSSPRLAGGGPSAAAAAKLAAKLAARHDRLAPITNQPAPNRFVPFSPPSGLPLSRQARPWRRSCQIARSVRLYFGRHSLPAPACQAPPPAAIRALSQTHRLLLSGPDRKWVGVARLTLFFAGGPSRFGCVCVCVSSLTVGRRWLERPKLDPLDLFERERPSLGELPTLTCDSSAPVSRQATTAANFRRAKLATEAAQTPNEGSPRHTHFYTSHKRPLS